MYLMLDLRYPIGQFEPGPPVNNEQRLALVAQLALVPAELRAAVTDLAPEQLDTPYRPGGWTVRQVVHHLADAQMNWYVRTKLTLTEDQPIVKPYDEARWAETVEALSGPIEPSLLLLDGLYQRWSALCRSLTAAQWSRTMVHPERGVLPLDATLPMHVWHGRHHTAHITELRKRMNWR
jgi:uncharacterized damage-inducible protein DinB